MGKRLLCVLLSCVLAIPIALYAAGCGSNASSGSSDNSSTSSDGQTVRIALCVQAMQEGIPARIRAQFPDVNFEFTLANNSADYYKYLDEHDDLPDIITVRRFSLRDSVQLKDKLVDVSQTDLASSYYQNYLQNYTYEDGTVNWLPATAEIWCIVANKTLFDKYDIEIPTDYESFAAACKAFDKKGIKGFSSDWSYDYTSLETLEGFNIAGLQSIDGRKWRSAYESGSEDGLDDTVWPAAFKNMYQVLKDTGNIGSSEKESAKILEEGFSSIQEKFTNGDIAMIRASGSDVVNYTEATGDEYIMLPYFGATEEDNWVLTYPYFQAAMNANSSVDADLLSEIYSYLLGQDCQDALDLKSNVLSYTSNVQVETGDQLSEIKSYLDNNQVFTRLANNAFFAASMTAVQGMISGQYDAEEAYEAMDKALRDGTNKEVDYDLNFDTGYSYSFDAEHGSQSASAILNSCREVWDVPLAVSYASVFSNSIYAGQASTSQLAYYLAGSYGSNYYMKLTGAQIKSLVGTMVHYDAGDTKYQGLCPVSDDMLPVSSGFEMEITKNDDNSYTLDGITINGEPIDEEETYTIVASIPSYYSAQIIGEIAGIELPEEGDVPIMPETLAQYFSDTSKQWVAPTDYITLK